MLIRKPIIGDTKFTRKIDFTSDRKIATLYLWKYSFDFRTRNNLNKNRQLFIEQNIFLLDEGELHILIGRAENIWSINGSLAVESYYSLYSLYNQTNVIFVFCLK